MKNSLLGLLAIPFFYLLGTGKLDAQDTQYREIEGLTGSGKLMKDIINFDRDFFVGMCVEENFEKKRIYQNFQADITESAPNQLVKMTVGAKPVNTKSISGGLHGTVVIYPKYASSSNQDILYTWPMNFYSDPSNVKTKPELCAGARIGYNAGRFRGNFEADFPVGNLDEPIFFTDHRVRTELADFGISARGRNIAEGYAGLYAEGRLFDGINPFARYAVRGLPEYPGGYRESFEIGLVIGRNR